MLADNKKRIIRLFGVDDSGESNLKRPTTPRSSFQRSAVASTLNAF
ncbi:hypothetical protein [Methylobacterium sp. WL6]|nr:hypothetical protein [Methylobacterium sp. WL6]